MQNPPGFSNNDLSPASEVPRTADLIGCWGIITDGRLLPLKKTNDNESKIYTYIHVLASTQCANRVSGQQLYRDAQQPGKDGYLRRFLLYFS